MKLLLENWREYLAEAKLQKVDWTRSATWPPGAEEANTQARVVWKKWMAEWRRLRKLFFAATKAEVRTAAGLAAGGEEMSYEEFERIADEYADHIMKPLGEATVEMVRIYHEAGFVPPPQIVVIANQWRSGELEKKARLEAELAAFEASAAELLKSPEELAQKIHSGEIPLKDLLKHARALDKKGLAGAALSAIVRSIDKKNGAQQSDKDETPT